MNTVCKLEWRRFNHTQKWKQYNSDGDVKCPAARTEGNKENSSWPQCNNGNRRAIKQHHLQSEERLPSKNTVPAQPFITEVSLFLPHKQPVGGINGAQTAQEANVNTALIRSYSIYKPGREGKLALLQCCPLLSLPPPTWSYLSFFDNSYLFCSPLPRCRRYFWQISVGTFQYFLYSRLGSPLVLMLSRVFGPCSSALASPLPLLGLWCWSGQRTEEIWEQKKPTLRFSSPARATAPPVGPEERLRTKATWLQVHWNSVT